MYTFIANPNARSGRGILLWKQIEKILLEKKSHIMFYLRNISIMLPACCMI